MIGLDELAAFLGWQAPDAAQGRFATTPEQVLDAVRAILAEIEAPLHVPHLGQMVRERTGTTLRESDYAGRGSLDAMLAALGSYVRREGPAGGHVVRPEWLSPPAEPPEATEAPPPA